MSEHFFEDRSHNLYQIFKGPCNSKWLLKISTGIDVYPDIFAILLPQGNILDSSPT